VISIQRKFLWGWGQEGKKVSWVKWNTLHKNKDEGGLGIKNLIRFKLWFVGSGIEQTVV